MFSRDNGQELSFGRLKNAQPGGADGYRLGTWTHNGIVSGPLGCAYETGSDFRIVWVIDNSLIGVIADGSNGPAMTEWSENSAYVVYGG